MRYRAVSLTILLATFVMCLPEAPSAQETNPLRIVEELSTADCANRDCNTDYTGSATDQFTVETEGQAKLKIRIYCSGTDDCSHCRGCMIVKGSDGSFFNCHTTNECGTGSCIQTCDPDPAWVLHPGATYTIYVCKMPCPGSTCASCPGSCVATGYVYQ